MPCVDAATRTRCVAVLAVIALHVLVLTCLRITLPPQRVQSAAHDKLLTVILTPAQNPQSSPPEAPKKSQHARPLSQLSASLPLTHRQIRPTTEKVEPRADTGAVVGEAAAEREVNHADDSKPADSTNNVDLNFQPKAWTSNAGGLDQRWLPRNSGAVQSGAARPDHSLRTNDDKVERAVSRSARTDCRTRYASMGLLAIPFLLKDTVNDTGCKW